MRVTPLGPHDGAGFLVEVRGVRLLLDCALDLSAAAAIAPNTRLDAETDAPAAAAAALKPFDTPGWIRTAPGDLYADTTLLAGAPELGAVDASTVDAVLVSNYLRMLALPFLTQYSGFRGRVLATEPTVQVARQVMLDLVASTAAGPRQDRAHSEWLRPLAVAALPPRVRALAQALMRARKIYTAADVEACIGKIEAVSYAQQMPLFGGVVATAVSSGHSLGAANWIVRVAGLQFAYVSSSSSSATRYPEPLDHAALVESDVLLLSDMARPSNPAPEAAVAELCSVVAATLAKNGSVLLPTDPTGVLFDLFEILHGHLSRIGMMGVPMYFLSHMAKHSLAYSTIVGEWLCKAKQDKVYMPEDPFVHSRLQSMGMLHHFETMDSSSTFSAWIKHPCIVFAGHPTLRCGDMVTLVQNWRKNPRHSIVFTDPDIDHVRALAPFQPVAMQVHHCPLDPRLSFAECNQMLRQIRPRHVLVPERAVVGADQSPRDGIVQNVATVIGYAAFDTVEVALATRAERAELEPALAAMVAPKPIGGFLAAGVVANVTHRDGQLALVVPTAGQEHAADLAGKRPLWGTVTSAAVLAALQAIPEARDARIVGGGGGGGGGAGAKRKRDDDSQDPDGDVVELPGLAASVVLGDGETQIVAPNLRARTLIKQALLPLLSELR